MTFTISLATMFSVLFVAFVLGLLSPLLLIIYMVWNAKIR
jgi:hypothetical protein